MEIAKNSYILVFPSLIAEKLDVKSIVSQMILGNALINNIIWLLREPNKE